MNSASMTIRSTSEKERGQSSRLRLPCPPALKSQPQSCLRTEHLICMDKPWTGTGVEPCDEAGISHRAGVFAMGCRGGRAGAVDSLLLQTLKFPPQLCTRRKPASGSPAWNEEWTFVMRNSTGTISADLKHETDGKVRCPPSPSRDEKGPSVIDCESEPDVQGRLRKLLCTIWLRCSVAQQREHQREKAYLMTRGYPSWSFKLALMF